MNRRLFLWALGAAMSCVSAIKRLAASPATEAQQRPFTRQEIARIFDVPYEVLQYGVVDSQGDIFAPGCFDAAEGQTFPLSIGFNTDRRIGNATIHSTEKAMFARLDVSENWLDRVTPPFEVAAAYYRAKDTSYSSKNVTLVELVILTELGICRPEDKIR